LTTSIKLLSELRSLNAYAKAFAYAVALAKEHSEGAESKEF